MPTSNKSLTYVPGFPSEAKRLREVLGDSEPDRVFGLWSLLSQKGARLGFGEALVLSGQAQQFVYDFSNARAAWHSLISPTEMLSRAFDCEWKSVTPSSAIGAYEIAQKGIAEGSLVLAQFRVPLLVFGVEPSPFESALRVLRLEANLPDETLTRADCDRWEWKIRADEENTLLRVDTLAKKEPDWAVLLPLIVRRVISNWRHEPLQGAALGLDAYRNFAADLRNERVDFVTSQPSSWMGPALFRQWSARAHLQVFFERMSPRFGGKSRQVMQKAGFAYGECLESWKKFSQQLERVYEREERGRA
ncbi:hypothetical protein IT157_01330 [bacterium]|nr:hypothetical protein [bacterium]